MIFLYWNNRITKFLIGNSLFQAPRYWRNGSGKKCEKPREDGIKTEGEVDLAVVYHLQ